MKAGFLGQCIEVLEREDPDILDYQYSGDFSGAIYPATPSQVPKDVLLDREYLINMILPVLINVSDKREFFVNDYIWGKVFKAELIRQYNILFDETRRKMEDRLFIVMSMQYAQSYYSMSAYGYYYVGHSFGQTLSTTFDENVFHMVADSCRKYRQMYADLYDFDQPYTVRYYCELLIRMAVDQFGYDIEPEQREKMFRIFVEDATLMDLFSRYLPDERWKKEVCSAILRQDLQRLYPIFEKQYKKRRQREAVSRYINIFRRIISGIKRRLLKSR